MTDVTLTVDGTKFTFQNGDVTKITTSIQSMAEQQEISASGPMGSYLYDYDGVIKKITISGTLTPATSTRISGYSITSLSHQKLWLESLINGSQNEITFTSNYDSTSVSTQGGTAPYKGIFVNTKCIIESAEFNEEEGNPNQIPFSMTLMVGNRT